MTTSYAARLEKATRTNGGLNAALARERNKNERLEAELSELRANPEHRARIRRALLTDVYGLLNVNGFKDAVEMLREEYGDEAG